MDLKKDHPNKPIKKLLLAGIHAYGVNMFCAGKSHANEDDKLERHYGDQADELMKDIIEIIEKDFIIKETES